MLEFLIENYIMVIKAKNFKKAYNFQKFVRTNKNFKIFIISIQI